MLRIISPRYALYTEMIHSNAIVNNREDISRFAGVANEDTVVQLGGCDPGSMALATKIVQDHGFKEVNINVGCPSDRVQHGKFGAVLMKTPHVVANILNEMDKASIRIPVTIKCRTGVDDLDSMEFLHNFVSRPTEATKSLAH
jgi:tRNA-dihydrouridine synthase A